MRKKLLIVVTALLMLFGSALTVFAGEIDITNVESSLLYSDFIYGYKHIDDVYSYHTIAYGLERNDVQSVLLRGDTASYLFFYDDFTKGDIGFVGLNTSLNFENEMSEKELFSYLSEHGLLSATSYSHAGKTIVTNTGEKYYYLYFVNLFNGYTYSNLSFISDIYDITGMDVTPEGGFKMFLNEELADRKIDNYENMILDESFGLTGFTGTCSGTAGTITATWTGTTHDDVIDTYNQADVGIRPWYYYKSAPEMLGFKSTVIEEYEIADKTFTKLYDELTPSDETLFLRCLEVIPTYQKESLGAVYKGKSCWIWFDEDGNVEKIENGLHDGEHGGDGGFRERDYSFELLDVYCGTMPFNNDKRLVSWEESSKDDLIRNLGYENTYVDIFCEGVASDGTTQKFDCTDSITTITGKSPIRVHKNSYLVGDDFTVAITDLSAFIIENDSLYDFDGIIYITPHYIRADIDYVGNSTMINLYTNDVSIVDDDESNDDEEDDNDSDDNPIDTPDIGDINDITDIFPYFFNLINILINSIGAVPKFFSTIFPFLPLEIRYILSIGLVLALILRLIGR